MSHPFDHARSSARRFGGAFEDYLPIHSWFDQTKEVMPDFRHRALRHHAEGIFMAEAAFGVTVRNSEGRAVPVRAIGEQHVTEDLGWIPTASDWLRRLKPEPWMSPRIEETSDGPVARPLARAH
jgi:hypothetical protein